MGTAASVLAGAKKALENANKFTSSVTGGQPSAIKPAASKYAPVREARKAPGEFMGIQSDQGAELKNAEANREAAKQALNQ